MNSILSIILFANINTGFMDTGYKKISCIELENILLKEDKNRLSFNQQLNTNKCYVYRLTNGNIAFLPNNLNDSSQGLIFDNDKVFNYYLQKDSFPIEDPERNIFQDYQSILADLPNQIPLLKKEISQQNNINGSLVELIKVLKEKWSKLKRNDRFFSILLLGEYIREFGGGKWMVSKEYNTFNPYLVPYIIYPNNNFIPLFDGIGEKFFIKKNLSLIEFVNWDENTKPKRNFENTFIADYKVFENELK